MVPSSDELEVFYGRLAVLQPALARRGEAIVRANAAVLAEMSTLAKDWIRLSQRLRVAGIIALPTLASCDQNMTELFVAREGGRRANYYRRRLDSVQDIFTEEIIVPVLRLEGDPHRVAARQLRDALDPHLTPQETAYAEEALKCVAETCQRAGIVLLWAAAVTRLHNSIEQVGFAAFNAAVATCGARKGYPFTVAKGQGPIGARPELQKVADFVILVVGMDLWRYDGQAFNELAGLLQTRNNAAHPGMASPNLLDVQQFTAKLIERVFRVIPR